MKSKLFIILLLAVAVFFNSARAVAADTLAVLDVYVLPRLPMDYLDGIVEPEGDDIFASERKGLERTLKRLVDGIVRQHSDYKVKKLIDPATLSVNPDRAFLYYNTGEDPGTYFDKAVLKKVAAETSVKYVLLGMVRELEIKRDGNRPGWTRMKIVFTLYDSATEEFAFTQTYENNTDGVTGYVDLDMLPTIQGRVPADIRTFVDSEAGRVFMSVAEVFVSDLTSTDVEAYLSDTYKVEGSTGYVRPGDAASGAGGTPAGGPRDQQAAMKKADCMDRGQAVAVIPPSAAGGLRVFACFDGAYDLETPDQVTGVLSAGKEGVASLSTGDFDGDGIDELVVTTYEPGEKVFIYKMKGRALDTGKVFAAASQLIPGVEVGLHAAAGDFDGDGTAELAVSAATAMDFTAVYDVADGQIKTSRPVATFKDVIGNVPRGTFVTAGDFDGDGRDDLAISSIGSGEKVKVFALPGGDRMRPVLLGDLSNFFDGGTVSISIAAGDFNADGKDELVVASMDRGIKIKVLAFDGKNFDTKKPLANIRTDTGTGARIAAGDFDGDGADDLAVSAIGAAQPEVWVFKYRRGAFDLENPYIGTSSLFPGAKNGVLMTIGKFE